MRIISLNAFGGHLFDGLMDFVRAEMPQTDIFCFQEMLDSPDGAFTSHGARANLYRELQTALPEFQSFFALTQEHFDETMTISENVNAGLAMFVRHTLTVDNARDHFIYQHLNSFVPNDFLTFPGHMHALQLNNGNRPLSIYSIHGASEPGNKLDCPHRLAQSQKILNFVHSTPGEKIIMGDFNLLPNTQSIRMFLEQGFRNLIAEFSITTTRGSMMHQLHPQYGPHWQEFADYAFISPSINVINFSVPDVPASDHLPLILEFSV